MARGKQINKRPVSPDPVFGSVLVERLINLIMERGKKTLARRIVYDAIGSLAEGPDAAYSSFETAMRNIIPSVEVRSRRVGGSNYQVPVPVRQDRGETLAIRWLAAAARSKKGKPMSERLASELRDAGVGVGEAMKKKEMVYKMAEANKAFSHFRW